MYRRPSVSGCTGRAVRGRRRYIRVAGSAVASSRASSNGSSNAATRSTASPGLTAISAGTPAFSPFRARRGTSAQAATSRGCWRTANGWNQTCSRRYRTGSTCSPCRACCGRFSPAGACCWASCATSSNGLLARAYGRARPGARPGMILFVQTFGDLVNFNPHIHVLAADGTFDADGGFTVLPPIPRKVLEPWFRREDARLAAHGILGPQRSARRRARRFCAAQPRAIHASGAVIAGNRGTGVRVTGL